MTKDELKKDLQKLGIEKDMRLLLHVSLSKIGNVTEGQPPLYLHYKIY